MDTLKRNMSYRTVQLILLVLVNYSFAHDCTVDNTTPAAITIDCSNRKLTSIPRDLPTANVVQLNLSDNALSGLNDCAFANFTDLKNLTLTTNQISTYTVKAFEGLGKLEQLDLTLNWLSSMPYPLCNDMPRLNWFSASFARLTHVPDNVFVNCSELRSIYMAQAGLTDIGTTFSNLPNLEQLYLTDNDALQITNENAFAKNPKLISLDLRAAGSASMTRLDHLPPAVTKVTSLEKLRVSKSVFKTFSTTDTAFFDHLKTLDAGDNPFSCTCDTTDFITWFQHTDVITDEQKEAYDCRSECTNCPDSYLMKDYNVKTCGGTHGVTVGCGWCVIVGIIVALVVVAAITIAAVFVMKRRQMLCFKNRYRHM